MERGVVSSTFTHSVGAVPASVNSVHVEPASFERRQGREERAQAQGRRRSMTRKRTQAPREEVKLGTKFGEELRSQVRTTRFTRASTSPVQLVTIEYDTLKNLKRRGIPITSQSRVTPSAPSAFPADDDGYCKPPPQR